jgi:ParB/RepB/Spo0J family partition protein
MQPELKQIPINQIHAASNYRKTFNDKSLKELAASIKENDVLEPIIVRPNNNGYQIVAGERRYRASKMAGKVTIPAVVREIADADILKVQIIENVQREGVQFMEEAYGVKRLRDELTLDVTEICKIIGKSDAYVYYMLQLTNMSDDARSIAEKGWISKTVAWEISKLTDKESQTRAANDLARPKRDNLVTQNGAKSYIRDTFKDSARRLRNERQGHFGNKSDYTANWKYFLVRLNSEQFEQFKKIVRGRTENGVLAEAVDCVMRGADA